LLIALAPASRELGVKVAQTLNSPSVDVEWKFFPDGECYVRFCGDVSGEDVVLVHSTHPPQDTHIIQLCLLISAALDQGAQRVSAAVPYIAYARQDKAFRPGEPVSIKTVLKLLEKLGLHRFITVNMHEPAVLSELKIRAENLDATPVLGAYLNGLTFNKPLVFAPDKTAFKIAKQLSAILGVECGWLSKERDRVTGQIKISEISDLDIRGRDVILADDIISTGGTMALAARVLRERGASKVTCVCVHPLLVGDAYDRISAESAGEIIGTDSVPSRVSKVSVAPLIAQALTRSA